MQNAYKEEIEACKLGLENAKSSLEMWYSQRHPEDSIVGTVKETLINIIMLIMMPASAILLFSPSKRVLYW